MLGSNNVFVSQSASDAYVIAFASTESDRHSGATASTNPGLLSARS
jgi:hypothetical protein